MIVFQGFGLLAPMLMMLGQILALDAVQRRVQQRHRHTPVFLAMEW